ncbi:MAG: hypothetical protein HYW03_01650 [Deltaproteobacteria bacterium]|nr:hypothetical protein [Deltaproteobacteria bacterium]
MNAWESIFRQSRVNDGYYDEDKLPQLKWDWPKGTWFQSRRDYILERHPPFSIRGSRNLGQNDEMATM